MCGATVDEEARSFQGEGLSPRVRGHQRSMTFCSARSRSIPACAGPPSGCRYIGRTTIGLSPRVRGHPVRAVDLKKGVGSIPACAGPPERRRPARPPSRVYPRVCGATWSCGVSRSSWSGLSPRVRGHRATVCQEPGATGPSLRVSLQRATVCRRVQLQA